MTKIGLNEKIFLQEGPLRTKCIKNLTVCRRKAGQALVEYVLLTLLASGIFAFFFGELRQSLFQMWVCDIGVRVQAPKACKNPGKCFIETTDFGPSKQAIIDKCKFN